MTKVKENIVIVINMRRKLLTFILVVSVVLMSRLYVLHSFSALCESAYVVEKIGNFWVAQNGTSGAVEFNTTDASTTIQSCIYNLTTNVYGSDGGRILLKSGSIFLTSPLVIPRPSIILEGEGRATGLVGNFTGDIITIKSANETPGYQYTMFIKIRNMLFYPPPNNTFTQTAIHLDTSGLKLFYINLEDLNIYGMNGIRTDQTDFGTTSNVMENLVVRNVIIQNAPSFGIKLWSSIDVTMDTVLVTFEQNGEDNYVHDTTGIQFTLNGVSSGTIITNTRVLRAQYGITIIGPRDLMMSNVYSDICETWAFQLNNTINCLLTNIYAYSPTGTGLWITGADSSQNRIIGATIKNSKIGVQDDTPQDNRQYFDSVISESTLDNSISWQVKQNDMFTNCNYAPTLNMIYVLEAIAIVFLAAVGYWGIGKLRRRESVSCARQKP